ncbi:MAG: hypothetical protein ACJ8C4_18500 [Gemmataceae bacterium]
MFQDCPCCNGNGHIKTAESVSIDAMRLIQLASFREPIRRIELRVHSDVATFLLNRKRRELAHFEEKGGLQVVITGSREVSPERLETICYDGHNSEIPLKPVEHRPEPRSQGHGHGGGRRR